MGIVITIGQYAILVIPTGIAGVYLMMTGSLDLTSILLPVLVMCVLNYFVGWVFMEVYETVVDTIFLCFLVDDDLNAETRLLADGDLVDLLDKYKDESEAIANKKKS